LVLQQSLSTVWEFVIAGLAPGIGFGAVPPPILGASPKMTMKVFVFDGRRNITRRGAHPAARFARH
jgi:hypothetical protein